MICYHCLLYLDWSSETIRRKQYAYFQSFSPLKMHVPGCNYLEKFIMVLAVSDMEIRVKS